MIDQTSWFLDTVCYKEQLVFKFWNGACEHNFNKTVIENVHGTIVCCWKCALGEIRIFVMLTDEFLD